ncbi:hypothetical protein [Roseivivax isoporae]|uniref:Uncharacterized protein n=1 Tax=Roseivivax isoporae LMG 25204 TaxID=1449351 RepID=X7F7U9_9RHOB|nr:hypothetical protein [Roseivivax isoporae]ETX28813.1 hypothetical protein RISW2_04755 [Roseivivax isoporae LMG 25204]
MRAAIQSLIAAAALAGCTQFPEVDATASPDIASADYPDLLPLEDLLAADAPQATPAMRDDLEARARALEARAGRLSGPVVDAPTRTRMDAGVPAGGGG